MAINTPSRPTGILPRPARIALAAYQLAVAAWFLYYDFDTLFQLTTEDIAQRLVSITLISLALAAGILLLRNPLLGRTFTVLHFLPQVLGIATPSFTFNAHHGLAVLGSVSGTPRTAGPGTGTVTAGAGTEWGDTIQLAINTPHPDHPGYTISLNILAAIIILVVLFCRQKSTQKAP